MTWHGLKRGVGPVLLGMLGMAAFYAGLHLWQDHQNLHALVLDAIQRQQAQQAQAK